MNFTHEFAITIQVNTEIIFEKMVVANDSNNVKSKTFKRAKNLHSTRKTIAWKFSLDFSAVQPEKKKAATEESFQTKLNWTWIIRFLCYINAFHVVRYLCFEPNRAVCLPSSSNFTRCTRLSLKPLKSNSQPFLCDKHSHIVHASHSNGDNNNNKKCFVLWHDAQFLLWR